MRAQTVCLILLVVVLSPPTPAQWSRSPGTNTAVCTTAGNQVRPRIVQDESGGAIIGTNDMNGDGRGLASGAYICRMEAGNYDQVVKAIDYEMSRRGMPMKRFLFSLRGCIFILAALCVGGGISYAQTTFERTYGNYGQIGYSVQQTSDGGYIVAGSQWLSGGDTDVFLLKISSTGDTLWTRKYGGPFEDVGRSVQQTSDGGYIIAGHYHLSVNYPSAVYLIKTNPSGDTLWTKMYGATDNYYGNSVRQTSDGGYAIVGTIYDRNPLSPSTVFLMKTNPTGDTLWTRTYGGTGYNNGGFSVQQTFDEGYIIAGFTESDYYDVYLIKTDSSGDTVWTRTYGSPSYECAYSVQQASDSGYVITGETGSWHCVYLLKTGANGDTLWTRAYYGGPGYYSTGYSVRQTSEGGYIITGDSWNLSGTSPPHDILLVKTDSSGDTVWTRVYGTQPRNDVGRSVMQTYDGGYIVAGSSGSRGGSAGMLYLIKTDPDGLVNLPDPPTLSQPPNCAEGLSTSPVLSWLTSQRARCYRLQVAVDSSFTELIVNDSTMNETTKPIADLGHNVKYYWRVSASNQAGTSGYSAVWTFTTALALPSSVTLILPVDKATVGKDSIRFVWSAGSPGVQRYGWELAADSLFVGSVVDSSITDTSKVLRALPGGQIFWWRVAAKNASGWGQFCQSNRFTTRLTDVSEQWGIPHEFSLGQNFPNPFNPSTTIRYGLPQRSHVTLTVFDILGQQVAQLANGEIDAGYHEVQLDGCGFSSGVYLYKIQVRPLDSAIGRDSRSGAADFVQTRKLLLVR